MPKDANSICPFCKSLIKEDDKIIECIKCGIPHHEECWNENNGCSTFGCSEQGKVRSEDTSNPVICQNCNTVLNDDEGICPNCLHVVRRTPPKLQCIKCKSDLADESMFCPKCGHKIGIEIEQDTLTAINQYNSNLSNPKNKNRLLIAALISVVVLGIVIYFIYQANEEKKANEYIANAKEFSSIVLINAADIEDIGNDIQSNWNNYIFSRYSIYYSIDDAVSSALRNNSSKIDSIKKNNNKIDDLYNKLKKAPSNKVELINIQDAVKELYNSYTDFYNFVTDPAGVNYYTFNSSFSSKDKDTASKHTKLNNLLK